MLQNFIRMLPSNRNTLALMYEARLLLESISPTRKYRMEVRYKIEPISNRLIGEVEEA